MRIDAFPAANGDCFLLSFGPDRTRHILVDGGRRACAGQVIEHLRGLLTGDHVLDLIVLTHFDADHIEGILEIAKPGALPASPRDFWFNGFGETQNVGTLGYAQADELAELLAANGWPHNRHFGQQAAHRAHAAGDARFGDAVLELVSPLPEDLTRLNASWRAWRAKPRNPVKSRILSADGSIGTLGRARKHPMRLSAIAGPTAVDTSLPNRCSIGFILDADGHRVLFLGDCHADQLVAAIRPLAAAACGRLPIDLVKISHHGSHKSTSLELLGLIDCQHFLISTDGTIHDHPDDEVIARIVLSSKKPVTLHFNYKTDKTAAWSHPDYDKGYGLRCEYPKDAGMPLTIDLAERNLDCG